MRPLPRPSTAAGQASAEYLGVVLLVGALLAVLTTVAVAAPGVTGAVMGRFEHALCVVGMDVCESADADAAGLAPCVTAGEDRLRATTLTLGFGDTTGADRLLVETRSDGTFRVTATRRDGAGATAGVGGALGPFSLGADVRGGLDFAAGTAVDVDRAQLTSLLRGVREHPGHAADAVRALARRLPAERVARFRQGEAGGSATTTAGGQVRGVSGNGGGLPGDDQELGARGALGRRTSAGVTTWYYDVGVSASGPLGDQLPVDGRRLAVAWERREPPVLTMTAAGAARDGRRTETTARMVLRTAADRALARRWVRSAGPVRDAAGRALAARMGDDATVQRFTYAETTDDEGSWGLAAELGPGLGVDHVASVTRRRLIDARILGRPVGGRRVDCVTPGAFG